MKIGEFFIDLVVDTSKGELTVGNLVSKMGELEIATVGSIGVLFELAQKMAGFTDATMRSALGLKDYNTLTGGNTMELQKWVRVAEHVQVSGDAVTSTFKGLAASIAEMQMTGKGKLLPLAERLGINLRGLDPAQILNAIRKSTEFHKLSNAQKTLLLGEVGIDPMMARVLDLSSKEFDKIGDQFAGISEKGQADFFTMAEKLTEISTTAKQVAIDIAEWDAGDMLKSLDLVLEGLHKIGDWFKAWKGMTDEDQTKMFDLIWRPLSKESKGVWSDLFRFIGNMGSQQNPIKSIHEDPHMYRDIENKIQTGKGATYGANTVEVHNHINFSGVHTPDSIKKSAELVFNTEWAKKLIQNGQVLSSGEVLA